MNWSTFGMMLLPAWLLGVALCIEAAITWIRRFGEPHPGSYAPYVPEPPQETRFTCAAKVEILIIEHSGD